MRHSFEFLRLTGSIAGLLAFLTGCASTSARLPSIPPGSTLEIRQTLEIPIGSARVFIQGGRVVDRNNIDPWAVYCSLQTRPIREAGETPLKVEPGRFEVYEVRQFNDINRAPRIYTTALGMGFDEWPAFIIYQVEMRLRSAQQPDLRALFCAKNGALTYGYGKISRYPNLNEIRAAVGNLLELRMP